MLEIGLESGSGDCNSFMALNIYMYQEEIGSLGWKYPDALRVIGD